MTSKQWCRWLVLFALAGGCDTTELEVGQQPIEARADGGTDSVPADGVPLAPAAEVSENHTDPILVAELRENAREEMTSGALAASIVVRGLIEARETRMVQTWIDGVSYEDHISVAKVLIEATLKGPLVPGEMVEVEYRQNAHNVRLSPGRSVLLFLESRDDGFLQLANRVAGKRAWRFDGDRLRATDASLPEFADSIGYAVDGLEGVR